MSDSWLFLAQYRGTCDRCEESIKAGQRVKFVSGDLMHTGCADGKSVWTKTRKEETCEKCWLIKPYECEETK